MTCLLADDWAFNVTFGVGLPECDAAAGDTKEMAVLVNDDDLSDFALDRSTSSDNAVLQGNYNALWL